MQRSSMLILILVIVFPIVAGASDFVTISLKGLEAGDVGTLLATIVFAALVIERAVEVYINNTYNLEEMRLSKPVEIAKQELALAELALQQEIDRQSQPGASANAEAITKCRDDVKTGRIQLLDEKRQIVDDLVEVKGRKAERATIVSTLLSFALAAVGFRIFGQFAIDGGGFSTSQDTPQGMAFRAADVRVSRRR